MKETILKHFENKNILILGFGKEGVSTYRFIRKYFPRLPLTIADENEHLKTEEVQQDPLAKVLVGKNYLDNLNDYDLIMKSPGVNLNRITYLVQQDKISSQTSLFIEAFSRQVIGVTGTKGKSTTASLIYHIVQTLPRKVYLAGNIGIPFFNIADQLQEDDIVVAELSAHQLEYLHASPHVAILLNLYQEHLDHFDSFSDYQLAKLNITAFQHEEDTLIYNYDDLHIPKLIEGHQYQRKFLPFTREKLLREGAYSYESCILLLENGEKISDFDLSSMYHLPGQHNYYNIMAAILASRIYGITDEDIMKALQSFQGLEHRIEFVATHQGISFYNDSISTIPEATIAAVRALRKVDTLILGGFDRGIDYTVLIDFLAHSEVRNIVFSGPAGKRIFQEWKQTGFPLPKLYREENDYGNIVRFAFENTAKDKICLLSPAASSYDQFKNFEERGTTFKKEIKLYAAMQ